MMVLLRAKIIPIVALLTVAGVLAFTNNPIKSALSDDGDNVKIVLTTTSSEELASTMEVTSSTLGGRRIYHENEKSVNKPHTITFPYKPEYGQLVFHVIGNIHFNIRNSSVSDMVTCDIYVKGEKIKTDTATVTTQKIVGNAICDTGYPIRSVK